MQKILIEVESLGTGGWLAKMSGCQIASNRDPLFAFNRDPSEALGLGLSM